MTPGDALDLKLAKEELFAYAKKSGALTVGVADAGAFEDAPEGHRPADLLPGAKAVLVLGGSPPRAGDWLSPQPQHMEQTGTSDRVGSMGLKVAHFIESRFGYYALFVPPGVDKGQQPFLSIMMAAEKAGCGSRSLAGPILHPEYGFMYYTAIITTLPLAPDAPLETPACPAPQCLDMWEAEGTTPCLQTCPIQEGGCLGGVIENGRVTERQYDRAKCTSRVYTYWVPGFQKALEVALLEEDKEKRKMILFSSFFTRSLWSITYATNSQGQCYECMRVCPVGAERRAKK
jgi:epoxyqueuosine reductase QueG